MITRVDGYQSALRDTTPVQTNKEVESSQGQTIPPVALEHEAAVERSFPQHKALYGPDGKTIEKLLHESEQAYRSLREIVARLLERQGKTFQDLVDGRWQSDFEVDDTAIKEAQALLDEGGPFSPEAVSERIVEAAKAFSGGDPEKIALMRKAIDAGFKAAAKALGGELPEISMKTYDLIQEKLDAWEKELTGQTDE